MPRTADSGRGQERERDRRGLSLRWRIALWVAAAQLAVLLLCGWLLLDNARQAIAEESRAGQALARRYAIATVGSLLRLHDPTAIMALLPDQLQQARHVRLQVIDRQDRVLGPVLHAEPAGGEAPTWFARLLRPRIEVTRVPVSDGPQLLGWVVISSAPGDEIAEVWADMRDLGLLAAAANLLLFALLLLAVGRALGPLRGVVRALGALEAGDYRARLPVPAAPELGALTRGFNSLAAALQRALAEKDRLNRRLVTLRDEERRQLAMELHDEFGPCLFGLKVEARAIAEDLAQSAEPAAAGAVGRARSIGAIVEQLQRSNRALLGRLRPMALGQLPLPQVLDDLVGTLAAHGPEIDWRVAIDPTLGGYDETTELTLYRVLQEALTNALRHGEPRRVEVRVEAAPTPEPGSLRLEVLDDGRGLPAGHAPGRGLTAMRERVEALGGRLSVEARPGGGTRVAAEIPLPKAAAGSRAPAAAGEELPA